MPTGEQEPHEKEKDKTKLTQMLDRQNPVSTRIEYKVSLLTHQCLYGKAVF